MTIRETLYDATAISAILIQDREIRDHVEYEKYLNIVVSGYFNLQKLSYHYTFAHRMELAMRVVRELYRKIPIRLGSKTESRSVGNIVQFYEFLDAYTANPGWDLVPISSIVTEELPVKLRKPKEAIALTRFHDVLGRRRFFIVFQEKRP